MSQGMGENRETMSLQIEHYQSGRNSHAVHRPVSVSMARGQALIIHGPNGVGKTTFLRSVVGFMPKVAGAITVNGAQVENLQDVACYAGHLDCVKSQLTVRENLNFWARLFGAAEVEAALVALDLEPIEDQLVSACSAGQKRRTGLARLLLSGRDIWLLDEPTVSLDVQAVALLKDAIEAHLGGGGMAIISTHDTSFLRDHERLLLEKTRETKVVDDFLDAGSF